MKLINRNESRRKQMTTVLRFVDKKDFIHERFVDLIHVKETTLLALKAEIRDFLSHYSLNMRDI